MLLTRVCACVYGFVVTVLVLDAFVAIEVRVTARARVPSPLRQVRLESDRVCFFVSKFM